MFFFFGSVAHVRVMGRSLAKPFRLVDPDESGKFGLKVVSYCDPKEMGEAEEEVGQRPFRQMRNLDQLLNFLNRHPIDVEYVWPESDDEEEEDDAESDGEV